MSGGFGDSGFGSGPYGEGTDTATTGRDGYLLTDARNVQHGSRFIDFKTGRWAFDSDGRTRGMSNAQQLVYIALATLKRSSAWDGGVDAEGEVIDAGFAQRREQSIRTALQHLTSADIIVIESITVDTTTMQSTAITRVVWRDLTTDEREQTEL